MAGVNILGSVFELTVMTLCLLQCFGRLDALLDEVHHLAEVDEFVADDLVALVEGNVKFETFSGGRKRVSVYAD